MKSQEERWLLKEKYDSVKSDAFFADCKALALGTPLAYLIGSAPFLNCVIHLNERPLIPRVETEFWVEQAIATIKEKSTTQPSLDGSSESVRILDLCAGSGCVGVAVAKAIPETLVDFGEIDARLLPTIQKNCTANNIDSNRYKIFHSNLFAAIPAEQTYDFILSNPPYIDPALNRTDENVKDFEPHLALYGGDRGIQVIEQLITTAPAHLTNGGQLWIEHEPEQVPAMKAMAIKHNFQITSHQDQYAVDRYSILVLQ